MNPAQLIGNPPPRIPPVAEPEAVPPVFEMEPVLKPADMAGLPTPKPSKSRKEIKSAVMNPPASLADDMAALQSRLAASLNVQPNARGGYDASAFVTALEAVHDRYVKARGTLAEWEATLEAREAKLAQRERDLSDAEDRAAAALRLAKLTPEPPVKKGWFW